MLLSLVQSRCLVVGDSRVSDSFTFRREIGRTVSKSTEDMDGPMNMSLAGGLPFSFICICYFLCIFFVGFFPVPWAFGIIHRRTTRSTVPTRNISGIVTVSPLLAPVFASFQIPRQLSNLSDFFGSDADVFFKF